MTALPLRDFSDAERAKLEAIEAAPAEPESLVMQVTARLRSMVKRYEQPDWSTWDWQGEAEDLLRFVLGRPC